MTDFPNYIYTSLIGIGLRLLELFQVEHTLPPINMEPERDPGWSKPGPPERQVPYMNWWGNRGLGLLRPDRAQALRSRPLPRGRGFLSSVWS